MMDGRDSLHTCDPGDSRRPPSTSEAEEMELSPPDSSQSPLHRGLDKEVGTVIIDPSGHQSPRTQEEVMGRSKRPRQCEIEPGSQCMAAGVIWEEDAVIDNGENRELNTADCEPRKVAKTSPILSKETFSAGEDSLEVNIEQAETVEKATQHQSLGIFASADEIGLSTDLPDEFKNAINGWGRVPINTVLPSMLWVVNCAMFSKKTATFCNYSEVWRELNITNATQKTEDLQKVLLKSILDMEITKNNIKAHEGQFKLFITENQQQFRESITSQGRAIINEIFELAASNPESINAMIGTEAGNVEPGIESILGIRLRLPLQIDISPIDTLIMHTSARQFPYFVPYSSALLWIAGETIDPLMTAFLYNRKVGASVYPFGKSFFIPYCVKEHIADRENIYNAAIIGVRNRGGLSDIQGDWMVTVVGTLPREAVDLLIKQLHLVIFEEFSYRVCDTFQVSVQDLVRVYYALVTERQYTGSAEELSTDSICSLLGPSNSLQLRDWAHIRMKEKRSPARVHHGFFRGQWQPYQFMVGANEDLWISIMQQFWANPQLMNSEPTSIEHYISRMFYDVDSSSPYNCWSLILFGAQVTSLHLLCGYLLTHSHDIFGFQQDAIEFLFAAYHERSHTQEDIEQETFIMEDEEEARLPPLAEIERPVLKQDWVIVTFKLQQPILQRTRPWHPKSTPENNNIVEFLRTSKIFKRTPAAHICATALSRENLTKKLGLVFTKENTNSAYFFGLPAEFHLAVTTKKDPVTDLGILLNIACAYGESCFENLPNYLNSNQVELFKKNKKMLHVAVQHAEPLLLKEVRELSAKHHVPPAALSPQQQRLISWVNEAYQYPISDQEGRHLFVQGGRGVGKTAFVNWMCENFVCYQMKKSSMYFDGILSTTQIIIVDDVRLTREVLEYLKRIMETYWKAEYKIKHGSSLVKRVPRLVIVSNLSFDEYFQFESKDWLYQRDSFRRRFICVNLDNSVHEVDCAVGLEGKAWRATLKVQNTIPCFLRFYNSGPQNRQKFSAAGEYRNENTMKTDAILLTVKLTNEAEKYALLAAGNRIPVLRKICTESACPDKIYFGSTSSLNFDIYYAKNREQVAMELNAIIQFFKKERNSTENRQVCLDPLGDYCSWDIRSGVEQFYEGKLSDTWHLRKLIRRAKANILQDLSS